MIKLKLICSAHTERERSTLVSVMQNIENPIIEIKTNINIWIIEHIQAQIILLFFFTLESYHYLKHPPSTIN